MFQRHRILVTVASALLASGCAVSPYQNQTLSSTTVPFDGLAIAQSANVIIEAYNWNTLTYEWRATTVAANTVTLNAGLFCSNSPAFYRYTTNVSLNSNYWKKDGTRYIAKLRATQLKNGNKQSLYFTDTSDGSTCVYNESKTAGCDFYDVAYNKCHFNQTEVIVRR